jgi:hypothetical protein
MTSTTKEKPPPIQHAEQGNTTNKPAKMGKLQSVSRKENENDHTDKHELREREVPHILGFAWPTSKKWTILSVIFLVQCSMNFNASIYANGVDFLTEKFNISSQGARVGQCVFLIAYAFGCELWAPWSEELGRRGTLQASLALVNGTFILECRDRIWLMRYSMADIGCFGSELWECHSC